MPIFIKRIADFVLLKVDLKTHEFFKSCKDHMQIGPKFKVYYDYNYHRVYMLIGNVTEHLPNSEVTLLVDGTLCWSYDDFIELVDTLFYFMEEDEKDRFEVLIRETIEYLASQIY